MVSEYQVPIIFTTSTFLVVERNREVKTRQRKICSHVTRIQAKECVSRYTIILNVLARNNR